MNYVVGIERRLLAILINHPGQVAAASKTLRDDSFADARHQLIYDNLLALTQGGGDVDELDVADLLESLERAGLLSQCGGRDYLLGLLEEPGTLQHKGLEALAEKIEAAAVRRRAADVLKTGLGKLTDGTVDSEEAMSELQGQLREILTVANREELAPVSEAVDELLEQLETGIDPGTPTGLERLDWYVLGGFKPTQMITLAGNTGSGKTSLALQIALRAAQWAAEKPSERGPVLIFSYEMARTELVQRMVGQVAEITDGFHPPEGFSRRDRPKVREALEKLRNIALRVEDASDATIEAVRAATERFIYANGILPSLVVVDHIGLMSAPSIKGGNRVAEVSHITKHLKRMASQLKIPVLALAQLSRANDKRDDHRPRLSDLRECLTGDALVLDPLNGTRRRIDSMLEGEHVVLAMNEHLRLVPASATAIASGEKEVFKLRTASGREIRASANHPFYTINGWKQLQELMLGEEIGVPRGYGIDGYGDAISADRARLLGYLIGDGSYIEHRSVSFVSADPHTLEDVRKIVAREFGLTARDKDHWSGTPHLDLTVTGQGRRNNPLIAWLRELRIHGQHGPEKRVPETMFAAPNTVIAQMIGRLFAADGTITHNGPDRWSIKLVSTSRQLLHDVQHLLLRFNIQSTIGSPTRHTKSTCDIAELRIMSRDMIGAFAASIPVPGKKGQLLELAAVWASQGNSLLQRDRLPLSVTAMVEDARRGAGLSIVGLGYRPQGKRIDRAHLAAVAERTASTELATLASSDVLWDPIVSIEPDGSEMTYDLQVAGHHNFVANDIVVHNSGTIEHDSNVVLLIFKENYHEADLAIREQQDTQGSAAKLMVAKNRSGTVGEVDLRWIGPRTLFYQPVFVDGVELDLEGNPRTDANGQPLARPDLDPAKPAAAAAGRPGVNLSELGDMFGVTPDEDELTGSEGSEPF